MRQLYRLCVEMGAARPAVILPARTLKPAHFRDRAGDLVELFCQRQADAIGSFGPRGSRCLRAEGFDRGYAPGEDADT